MAFLPECLIAVPQSTWTTAGEYDMQFAVVSMAWPPDQALDVVPVCSGLIKFRRQHPLLGRPDFLVPEDITWHEDNWENPESKFLAFSLHDRSTAVPSSCAVRSPACPVD